MLCLHYLWAGYYYRAVENMTEPYVELATLDDLDELTELLMALFEEELDFEPDREKQEHGLRLVLENPSRGRIFVLRTEHAIMGMASLLFTISTAEGGFALNMEDVVIHPDHRGNGYGTKIMESIDQFAKDKNFKRITLLTDRISEESQRFFEHQGFSHSEMIPMRKIY